MFHFIQHDKYHNLNINGYLGMGKQQLVTIYMILLSIFKCYFSLKNCAIRLKIPHNYQKNNSPKSLQVIIYPFLSLIENQNTKFYSDKANRLTIFNNEILVF